MPTIFPLYTLAYTHGIVIAAGGGGNPLFGKKNGLIVMDSTTNHELLFFETDCMIRSLRIYRSTLITLSVHDCSTTSHADSHTDSIHAERLPTTTIQGVSDHPNSMHMLPHCHIYMTLIGDGMFYHAVMVRDVLHVIDQYRMCVSQHAYVNVNVLVADKKMMAYMPMASMVVERGRNGEKEEEYFYEMRRCGDRVVMVREDGHSDVGDNWEGFFYRNRRMYKILVEDVVRKEDGVERKGEGEREMDHRMEIRKKWMSKRFGIDYDNDNDSKGNNGSKSDNDSRGNGKGSIGNSDGNGNIGDKDSDSNKDKDSDGKRCYTFVYNLKKYQYTEVIASPEIVCDYLVFYLKGTDRVVFIKETDKEVALGRMERITCISNYVPEDRCSTCDRNNGHTDCDNDKQSGSIGRTDQQKDNIGNNNCDNDKQSGNTSNNGSARTDRPFRLVRSCRDCVRITCNHLKDRNDYFITVTGTSSGRIYILKNTRLVNTITPCSIPITSIAVCGDYVYYCSLNGLVDRRVMVKRRGMHALLLMCVMVVGIAVYYGLYRRVCW